MIDLSNLEFKPYVAGSGDTLYRIYSDKNDALDALHVKLKIKLNYDYEHAAYVFFDWEIKKIKAQFFHKKLETLING